MDWFSIFLLILFPYLLFGIAFIMENRSVSNWIIRKFIHTIGLTTAAIYATFIDDFIDFIFIVFVLVITLLILTVPKHIRIIFRLLEMGTREGEKTWMSFINVCASALTIIGLRFYFIETRWIFFAAVLCVAFGDGLGEFVGRPYGKHEYKIFSKKSIEGSLGVLVGSFIAGLISMLAFNEFSITIFISIIVASVIVTLIEALSYEFLDNVLMPILYSAILLYYDL